MIIPLASDYDHVPPPHEHFTLVFTTKGSTAHAAYTGHEQAVGQILRRAVQEIRVLLTKEAHDTD